MWANPQPVRRAHLATLLRCADRSRYRYQSTVSADDQRAVRYAADLPVLAAPLLAQFIGGGPDSLFGDFMLAFISAVAFATIVAVVAGLVLASASAMAHDLYVGVVRHGKEVSRADRSRPRASPRSSSGRCRSASVSPLKARMSPRSSALYSRWRRARISRAYRSRCTGSAVIPAALSPACWWARSPRSD